MELSRRRIVPTAFALLACVCVPASAAESGPEPAGSAIYSPYSTGVAAEQEHRSLASTSKGKSGPDWAMTLAATAAGACFVFWLLRRV